MEAKGLQWMTEMAVQKDFSHCHHSAVSPDRSLGSWSKILVKNCTYWWDQGGLTPGIRYTRSNFFIKGGKVTTPTITGDIFSPCDVKNTLIKLNNQLPNMIQTPLHQVLLPPWLILWTTFASCPTLLADMLGGRVRSVYTIVHPANDDKS